jgi:hypothetical protein
MIESAVRLRPAIPAYTSLSPSQTVYAPADSRDSLVGPVGEPIKLARTQCFKLGVHVPFEGNLMDALTPEPEDNPPERGGTPPSSAPTLGRDQRARLAT